MSSTVVDIDLLHRFLRYEPETGKLFWNAREPSDFTDGRQCAAHACARWNGQHAGKEALTGGSGEGYLCGTIKTIRVKAHRVIWAIAHGEWPAGDIDHINGVRADNRIVNLRAVSGGENHRNQAIPINNTSGHIGVSWHSRDKRWVADIRVDRHTKHLGTFCNIADAIAARRAAEQRFGFHPNHGRAPPR